jgi:hypothetical protein
MVSAASVHPSRWVIAAAEAGDVELISLSVGSRRGGFLPLHRQHVMSTTPVAGAPPSEQDAVECIAFSPDGRLLATGEDSGLVRLWAVSDAVAPPVEMGQMPKPRPVDAAAAAASDVEQLAALHATGGSPDGRPPLHLVAELRGEWRPIGEQGEVRRNGRVVVLSGRRKVVAVHWLPHARVGAAAETREYALLASTADGATTVWTLSLQLRGERGPAGSSSAPLCAATSATALPCLGPKVEGHRHGPVGGKRSARPGERDAGRWWHRGLVSVRVGADAAPAADGAASPAGREPAAFAVSCLESSEKGAALLCRWLLHISDPTPSAGAGRAAEGGDGVAFIPALPRAPLAASATAGYTPDQLVGQPVQLQVRLRHRERDSPTACDAATEAAAGAELPVVTAPSTLPTSIVPLFEARGPAGASSAGASSTAVLDAPSRVAVLACRWLVADSQPAGVLAHVPPTALAGSAAPLPAAGAAGLLLLGTADGRVAAHDYATLGRLRASLPLRDGDPLMGLAYSARTGTVVAGAGREVLVYPLQAALAAGVAASSTANGDTCCSALLSLLLLLSLLTGLLLLAMRAELVTLPPAASEAARHAASAVFAAVPPTVVQSLPPQVLEALGQLWSLAGART